MLPQAFAFLRYQHERHNTRPMYARARPHVRGGRRFSANKERQQNTHSRFYDRIYSDRRIVIMYTQYCEYRVAGVRTCVRAGRRE